MYVFCQCNAHLNKHCCALTATETIISTQNYPETPSETKTGAGMNQKGSLNLNWKTLKSKLEGPQRHEIFPLSKPLGKQVLNQFWEQC